MSAKTTSRRLLRLSFFLIAAVLAVAILVFAALQTPPGRELVLSIIQAQVAARTPFTVEARGLSGLVPWNLKIDQITIRDKEGVWLEINNTALRGAPGDLFFGRPRLSSVSVETATVNRKPVRLRKWRLPKVPGYRFYPHADKIDIKALVFEEPVFGERAAFHAEGAIAWTGWGQAPGCSFSIRRTDKEGTNAAISFANNTDLPGLDIHVDDATLFPLLSGKPDPVSIDIKGSGPREKWNATANFNSAAGPLLSGSATVSGTTDSEITANIAVFPGQWMPAGPLSVWLGEKAHAEFSGTLTLDGLFTLQNATLDWRHGRATADGSFRLKTRNAHISLQMSADSLPAVGGISPLLQNAPALSITASLDSTPEKALIGLDLKGGGGQLLGDSEWTLVWGAPLRLSGVFTPHRQLVELLPWSLNQAFPETPVLTLNMACDTERESLHFETISLAAGEFRLAAQGTHFLSGSSTDISLEGILPAPLLEHITNTPVFPGNVAVSGSLEGNETVSKARFGFETPSVSFGVFSLEKAEAAILKEAGSPAALAASPNYTVKIHSESCLFNSVPMGSMEADFPLVAEKGFSSFTFTDATAALDALSLRLEADGSLALPENSFSVDGTLISGDLSTSAMLLPFAPKGQAVVTAKAKGIMRPLALEGGVTLKISGLQGLPQSLQQLSGPSPSAQASLTWRDGAFSWRDGELAAESLSLKTDGSFTPSSGGYDIVFSGKAPDLAAIIPTGGKNTPSGEAAFKGNISGDETKHAITGGFSLKKPGYGLFAADTLSGDFLFEGKDLGKFSGKVKATAQTKGKPRLDGTCEVAVNDDAVQVRKGSFSSGPNRASGSLDWNRKDASFKTGLTFDLPDLGRLSLFGEHSVAGGIRGDLELHGGGRDAFRLKTNAKAQNLHFDNNTLESAKCSGNFQITGSKTAGSGTLDFTGLSAFGILSGGSGSLALSAKDNRGNASLNVSGSLHRKGEETPLPVQFSATTLIDPARGVLEIEKASLSADTILMETGDTAVLTRAGDGWTLENLAVRSGGGGASLSGKWLPGNVTVNAEWEDFPLSIAALFKPLPLSGTFDGTASLSGTTDNPSASFSLSTSNARMTTASNDTPPVTAECSVEIGGGRLKGTAKGLFGDAGRGVANGEIPFVFHLAPLTLSPSDAGELALSGKGELELDSLAQTMGLVEHHPRGTLLVDFACGGTRLAPVVRGKAELEDGAYENLSTGTRLQDISLRLEADASRLVLTRFTARDIDVGTVSGKGTVDLAQPRRLAVELTLNNLLALNNDYASARFSGPLILGGSLSAPEVGGSLVLNQGDFEVPEKLPGGTAPALEVTEINGPVDGAKTLPRPVSPAILPAVTLNIGLDMPSRLFVRAPVLDSEWKGSLRARGTLSKPSVGGTMTISRGSLDFFGRRFDLRDSTITLNEDNLRDPYVNIKSTSSTASMTATMLLSGQVSEASLSVVSEPPMPQDEALAMLLFRRNVSQISPVQAVQLARAVTLLSRRMSMAEFLSGKLRIPGLDVFDVRTGETVGDTTVGVGKYINDRIYLEAQQGASTDSGKVSAEVEVTPNVSVKADVGSKERGGLGVVIRKDY